MKRTKTTKYMLFCSNVDWQAVIYESLSWSWRLKNPDRSETFNFVWDLDNICQNTLFSLHLSLRNVIMLNWVRGAHFFLAHKFLIL